MLDKNQNSEKFPFNEDKVPLRNKKTFQILEVLKFPFRKEIKMKIFHARTRFVRQMAKNFDGIKQGSGPNLCHFFCSPFTLDTHADKCGRQGCLHGVRWHWCYQNQPFTSQQPHIFLHHFNERETMAKWVTLKIQKILALTNFPIHPVHVNVFFAVWDGGLSTSRAFLVPRGSRPDRKRQVRHPHGARARAAKLPDENALDHQEYRSQRLWRLHVQRWGKKLISQYIPAR